MGSGIFTGVEDDSDEKSFDYQETYMRLRVTSEGDNTGGSPPKEREFDGGPGKLERFRTGRKFRCEIGRGGGLQISQEISIGNSY